MDDGSGLIVGDGEWVGGESGEEAERASASIKTGQSHLRGKDEVISKGIPGSAKLISSYGYLLGYSGMNINAKYSSLTILWLRHRSL